MAFPDNDQWHREPTTNSWVITLSLSICLTIAVLLGTMLTIVLIVYIDHDTTNAYVETTTTTTNVTVETTTMSSGGTGNQSIGGLIVDPINKLLSIENADKYLSIELGVHAGDVDECHQTESHITCSFLSNSTMLNIDMTTSNTSTTYTISWMTLNEIKLQDRVAFGDSHWYGGAEMWSQSYPLERQQAPLGAYVTGDIFQNEFGPKMEKYWLSSNKFAITSPFDSTLWVGVNDVDGMLSLHSQVAYSIFDNIDTARNSPLQLTYSIIMPKDPTNTTLRDFHINVMTTEFDLPQSMPDKTMMIKPFWSTWAELKKDITNTTVTSFAAAIISHGFTNNSHFEIDDKWQSHYGDLVYNSQMSIFTISNLNGHGFPRVTIWSHPFVNLDSAEATKLVANNQTAYMVQNSNNQPAHVYWWDGPQTSWIYDMTSSAASADFLDRHLSKTDNFGLDVRSYKFDAGSTAYLGRSFRLANATHPNDYTREYATTIARVNNLIEMRVACGTQSLGRLVRLMDKSSVFGMENGLQSMISAMISMSIIGYPFLLPDMIGGNAYKGNFPTPQLYVRWVQANVFMPAMQFSIAPWDTRLNTSDIDVVAVTMKMYKLRESYADYIWTTAEQSRSTGIPMIRPLWFVEETEESLTTSDTYMFGNDILVAPMIAMGTSRSVYLPRGKWAYQNDKSKIHQGPTTVKLTVNYDELAYFVAQR